MSSSTSRPVSPPVVLSQSQSRSPTATTTTTTSMNTSTHTTPSKAAAHHHHLPVGHTLHSPAHSASGDVIQGKPSDAGGLHTSTSRGNILLPPPSLSSAPSTPADLLSVSSRSPSSVAFSSRPASPAASNVLNASAPAAPAVAPGSPSLATSASAIPSSPAMLGTNTTGGDTRSRPTSPARSRSPLQSTHASPRSPNLRHQQQQQNQQQDGAEVLSMSSSTPQLDSSAVFERDVEFANEHLLTGSEAIDLAAAPVLSEVALAVTSDDISALTPSASSNILSGGSVSGTASPLLTQSLDSTILSSSPGQLPSNAVLFNDSSVQEGGYMGYGGSAMPLSEQLRRSSGTGAGAAGRASSSGRPTSEEFSSSTTGISPPPSLSLSPSASTNSPVSSTPASPVHSMHPSSAAAAGGSGGAAAAGATVAGGQGQGPFGYGLTSMEQLGTTGLPMDGADSGALGMQSPPGSSHMSGVSLSGSKDSKRRLSMISYADIINSERLSDTHSNFSSPTPSSALSLSAAALPVQGTGTQSPTPAQTGGGILSPSSGLGAMAGATGAGTGSALYSPLTSPEESTIVAPEGASSAEASKEGSFPLGGASGEQKDVSFYKAAFAKPANNRTDTTSTNATEVFYMPGQIPLQTPPAGVNRNNKEDTDVTPTSSKIKSSTSENTGLQSADEKLDSSTSSWNMLEMGKALVGSAAGAVGSVLSASGIGNGDEDEDAKEKSKPAQGN